MRSSESGSPGADRIVAVARAKPSMSRACSSGILLALLFGGCFAEPGIEPGDGGQTTGQACTEGSIGCACYGNGTCDAGLLCDAELERCIPEGCTPGAIDCPCAAGACDAPAECRSGICEVPGEDDGQGSGASTTAPGDDGPVSTNGPTDDTSSAADASSGEPATGSGPGSDTGDTGDPICDEGMECGPCFQCADGQPGACQGAHEACSEVAGCLTAVACLTDCGLTGLCFEPCCEGLDQEQQQAVNQLILCRTDHCTSACAQQEIPTCS